MKRLLVLSQSRKLIVTDTHDLDILHVHHHYSLKEMVLVQQGHDRRHCALNVVELGIGAVKLAELYFVVVIDGLNDGLIRTSLRFIVSGLTGAGMRIV